MNPAPFARAGALLALLLAGLVTRPPASVSGPIPLADSTVTESWVLSNGLRVVTRHVPICEAVDVTLAYRIGSADDPPGREGLASVLAEVAYTAGNAEIPERTRGEMFDLRPAGWNLMVSPRVTQLSELGRIQQLPGVLHQVASRMRGVIVTPAVLRAAVTSVRADLDSNYHAAADRALYYGAREWAMGDGARRSASYASGKGLQKLGPKEVERRLRAAYVPANAVLSIAGNLTGLPLRAMVQSEFGSIPSGRALPPTAPDRPDSTYQTVVRPGLKAAIGVLGLFAPALTDTTHPAFLLRLLLTGGFASERWGDPPPPLTTHFQYSILDDPALARFYPPVGADAQDPRLLDGELIATVSELDAMTIPTTSYEVLWRGVNWLLGGPMPPEVLKRVAEDNGALHALASSMATRELWGGEPFWSDYRRRLRAAVDHPPPANAFEWFVSPERQVQLLFVPRP